MIVRQLKDYELHIIGNDFKDYVYLHKIGAYVCDDCFCQRKHKNGGGGKC